MGISYDVFVNAFLSKITEYELLKLNENDRTDLVDSYLRTSSSSFNKFCKYDLSDRDDEKRMFNADIDDSDLDDIIDIVSEGMLIQWMKPYVYKQENLENMLNTTDYSGYSPAELLHRISEAYTNVKKDYRNMVVNYTYDKGYLTTLSL